MTLRQWIGTAGVLLVAAALTATLPGCGDTGAGDEEAAQEETVIVNPSPESLEPEGGLEIP